VSAGRQDFEDDLEVVARYFAFEGGDSSDDRDEVIWARLTKQRRCKTANSWEQFYNQHHVAVNALYEEFVDTEVEAGADSSANS